jgi:hypothetical protein
MDASDTDSTSSPDGEPADDDTAEDRPSADDDTAEDRPGAADDTAEDRPGAADDTADEGLPSADDDTERETPEPTPQSAALRRQQRYVGIGGALVGGAALTAIALQQFTDSPALAGLAGVAGTAVVLWLARKSIFPGESATHE